MIKMIENKKQYRKVWCITRDNVQDAPPKVEEKTWHQRQNRKSSVTLQRTQVAQFTRWKATGETGSEWTARAKQTVLCLQI